MRLHQKCCSQKIPSKILQQRLCIVKTALVHCGRGGMRQPAQSHNSFARHYSAPRHYWPLAVLAALVACVAGGRVAAGETLPAELQRIYYSGAPKTLDDLRLMDQHQQALVQQVTRVTVGLQIGATQGSGVLVDEEGHILTAAHVAGRAGLAVRVIMPDGKRYDGTTLGMNKSMDAALVKLKPQERDGEEVQWPFAEMGQAVDMEPGSWCLALGHPGGYQADRQPVARFGRVIVNNSSNITTDCKLVGGDSGGPLFDMEGRVIGIHSRIGSKITKNLHVPVDAYRTHWTRLARSDMWGSLLNVVGRPVIGVLGEQDTNDPRVSAVIPASPAERAGIQPGDLVTQFDNQEIKTFDDLKRLVSKRQPGDEVTLKIERGSEEMKLTIVLASIANKQ